RVLRAELWRTTGCLCDIEKLLDGPRKELHDRVVEQVASSLIQQRERMYDLCDDLVGYTIGQFCPQGTHEDDWDLDGLHEALREQFNMEFDLPRKDTSPQQIAELVWEQVAKRARERQEELTRPWLMYFLRHFYLEEIDNQWIDHLKTM